VGCELLWRLPSGRLFPRHQTPMKTESAGTMKTYLLRDAKTVEAQSAGTCHGGRPSPQASPIRWEREVFFLAVNPGWHSLNRLPGANFFCPAGTSQMDFLGGEGGGGDKSAGVANSNESA